MPKRLDVIAFSDIRVGAGRESRGSKNREDELLRLQCFVNQPLHVLGIQNVGDEPLIPTYSYLLGGSESLISVQV